MLRPIETTHVWNAGSMDSFHALRQQEQCSDLLIEVNNLYENIEGKIEREKGDNIISSEAMNEVRDLIGEFGSEIGELWGVNYKRDTASRDLRRKYAASQEAEQIALSEEYSPSEKRK